MPKDKKKRKDNDRTDEAQPRDSDAVEFEDRPYPYSEKMDKKEYRKTLRGLQIELLKLQRWLKAEGERILIIFEGRDAAGKGGTIKRFTEYLNPRGARVVALMKPTDAERGQWYFQRYIAHLPTAGEIVFFDRSWYNRAGVEPVMGFCEPHEYLEFMQQAPDLERSLVQSGIRLFKLWFAVSQDEQLKRFNDRRQDPLKRWKLSPIDEAGVGKWRHYTLARDRMFFQTHTKDAPWSVIRSDCKRRARINAIRQVLRPLDYDDKDPKIACPPDPRITGEPSLVTPSPDELMFNFVVPKG